MGFPAKTEVDQVRFRNGVVIITGPKVTRATVQAEWPGVPIGSQYISSVATGGTGRVYLKVTNTNAATDWEKFTTSAAD